MILTVEPNLSASGVKKKPQTSPTTSVIAVSPLTQGNKSPEVCMNFFGLAYSQIDMVYPWIAARCRLLSMARA